MGQVNSNGDSDDVTLFPSILQPVTALKAYAPIGIKFWENQETALEGLKEFADGWFARRHRGMQAALEAAKHLGDAETPSDILREYQSWLTREMELVAEDGKAYREQVLRAGAHLSARPDVMRSKARNRARYICPAYVSDVATAAASVNRGLRAGQAAPFSGRAPGQSRARLLLPPQI
jgi:hypothetical protein